MAVALLAGACDGTAEPSTSATTSASPTDTPSDGGRVDRGEPTFSGPTSITTSRRRTMKYYEASSIIEASTETVWAILTDAPNYPSWESGVIRVEGRVASGERIKVVSEANPKGAFPVKVTVFDPPRAP